MNELLNKLNKLAKEYRDIGDLLNANNTVYIRTDDVNKMTMNEVTGLLDAEKDQAKAAIGNVLTQYRQAVAQEFKSTIAEIDALL